MPFAARASLALCLAVGSVSAVAAEVVDWLYDVEIPVASQTDAERSRAAREALDEVLVRVTGMAKLPQVPQVAEALRRPERFYARYEYSRRQPVAQERDSATPATFLQLHFEAAAVLDMLRSADLPVWVANRPTLLAWVAVQRDGRRSLLSATSASELAAGLQRRARQRGLKLLLPLLDLQDSALAANAVWGLFWEDIHAASARYAPDLLLIGRAVEDVEDNWTADWQLRVLESHSRVAIYDGAAVAAPQSQLDGFAESFGHRAASARETALAALDGAADALADRFAVRGTLGSIPVVVRGAQTVRGYASLLAHLKSREFIERVDVDAVQPTTLGLRLHSRSNREQLRKLLSMGEQLVVESTPDQPLAVSWRGAR